VNRDLRDSMVLACLSLFLCGLTIGLIVGTAIERREAAQAVTCECVKP